MLLCFRVRLIFVEIAFILNKQRHIIKRLMNASFVNVMITGNVQYALRVLELMNMV